MTPFELSHARVVDAMGHAVMVTAPGGVILAWNPGAEQLFGWSADEAIGERMVDLLVSSDKEQNAEIQETVLAGSLWSGDYLARRKDGETVLVHATSAPIRDDAGKVVAVVSVSHDVSERRSSEESLRAEEERLRLAFASARMGAWSWDVETGMVKWDEHMEARYGLAAGEFGGTFDDYIARLHPDDRDRVVQQIEAAQHEQSDLTFEHRALWPDGSLHWLEARGRAVLDEAGAFIGMVGVGIDIDERKELEALIVEATELRANARVASDLQEAERIAGLGSWRWEAATNVVTLSSEMARMLDCAPTMSGLEFADALRQAAHPDDVPEVERAAGAALGSGRSRFFMECRFVVAGDIRQMAHRGEMLYDDQQRIVAVRGTFQDVTVQKRAEAALRATRERLASERSAVDVLQESLIRPEFPELPDFDIAARYLAAFGDAEIGGDWYDAFALPDGRVMLAVGDVSGHGLSSARLMAKLRHATRAYACVDDDLSLLFARLDNFLIQFRDDIEIATLLVARLEPETGGLELVSAGHLPPLRIREHDSAFLDVLPGLPLGAPNDAKSVPTRAVLEPGDALLLYTDGLVERRTEGLDEGLERLRTSARASEIVDADALCELAIAACLADVKAEDDVCMLAVRRIGGTSLP
jgi:PAS domain S-box-containing protein